MSPLRHHRRRAQNHRSTAIVQADACGIEQPLTRPARPGNRRSRARPSAPRASGIRAGLRVLEHHDSDPHEKQCQTKLILHVHRFTTNQNRRNHPGLAPALKLCPSGHGFNRAQQMALRVRFLSRAVSADLFRSSSRALSKRALQCYKA